MANDRGQIEVGLTERLRAAGITLRNDKVVRRFVGRLEEALTGDVADGEAMLFTVTAPIRVPARTAAELASALKQRDGHTDRSWTIGGNNISARLLRNVAPAAPKVLGFAHNVASDSLRILNTVEACLSHKDQTRAQPKTTDSVTAT